MPIPPADPLNPNPPGQLIVADYQYEFRGLLFGSRTQYQVESMDGLLSLPSAKGDDDENQEDHGSIAGVDLIPPRTITSQINTLAEGYGTAQPLIDAAARAFQVSKRAAFVEYAFVTQRPGHTKRFCLARARRSDFPSNFDTAKGLAKGAMQLFATDPRFYSLAETITDIIIPNAGANNQGNVVNNGNLLDGTFPILEITGPSTNPRIQNNADGGRTIRIDVVIPAGQTLTIDTKNKTVFLNGVDRYDTVRSDNQWWVILPGVNVVVYNRTGAGNASQLRVRHNDAWTGA